ncbi:hypothetical protein H1P_6390009 [Hyella patelloides LEGE 07179]|uniref:Uncharacterized protein n=1 Tax=Hyella patelloides LEGE 07179 TaxID=945734 RepID=A0A563W2G7_9CYAN|nr:hypothetical protein H1P_6390009 [Hyella patelloides LEGE 07179]
MVASNTLQITVFTKSEFRSHAFVGAIRESPVQKSKFRSYLSTPSNLGLFINRNYSSTQKH